MECGCSPGSWSQVGAKLVNAGGIYDKDSPRGFLVGCDLLHMEQVPGAILLPYTDFTSDKIQDDIIELFDDGQAKFDVVLSDMAPNATGQRGFDHDRIMQLAFKVREFTLKHGRSGSTMVIKVLEGSSLDQFKETLMQDFSKVRMLKPKASRLDSAETYVIAMDLIKSQS